MTEMSRYVRNRRQQSTTSCMDVVSMLLCFLSLSYMSSSGQTSFTDDNFIRAIKQQHTNLQNLVTKGTQFRILSWLWTTFIVWCIRVGQSVFQVSLFQLWKNYNTLPLTESLPVAFEKKKKKVCRDQFHIYVLPTMLTMLQFVSSAHITYLEPDIQKLLLVEQAKSPGFQHLYARHHWTYLGMPQGDFQPCLWLQNGYKDV